MQLIKSKGIWRHDGKRSFGSECDNKENASSLNIAIPDSVSDDTLKEMGEMKMKKGKDFDKEYLSMMVYDQKKDMAEFGKCADNCSDSTIKSFAYNTLRVLEKHMDSIQAIANKKPQKAQSVKRKA
jgi:putative membrane protein